MVGYTIKPRARLLFVGPGNARFGICGKAWRVGLGLGPSDSGLDCGKHERIRDKKITHDVGGEIWCHPCLFGLMIGWRSR